ncbi:MAG: AtpZ/AtpI family protein [Ignavibacteriaceae bacterium]
MLEKKDSKTFNPEIVKYLGLGTQLAATVTIMVFVGIWLDGKFNTNPILTIACSFLGIFAGMYSFIRSVIKPGK